MSNPGPWRSAALALGVASAIAAALVIGVHRLLSDRIAAEQRREQLAMLSAVLPADLYDNDPLADRIVVRDRDAFGADEPVPVLRARRHGTPSALVLRATARGYVGPIRLLIGVRDDGTVLGVRVTRHQETPGFGDGIEPSHGDWITRFAGRSLDAPAPERWAVRADGGDFDQFSGATITPRAIVTQVRKVLEYVALHRDALFANDAAASRIAP